MYVYLLSNGDFYKIGVSKNPTKRVKQLETGSSSSIILYYQYKSRFAFKIESALHKSYPNENLEWFSLTIEEVLDFMNQCKKIENNLIFLEENKI